MEQANMLLSGAADANDKIRDANANDLLDYQGKVSKNKDIAEGEDWYHGVSDTIGVHGALHSAYNTAQRAKNLGLSYGGLAKLDAGNAAESVSKSLSSAGSLVKSGVKGGIATLQGKTTLSSLGPEVESTLKSTSIAADAPAAGEAVVQTSSDALAAKAAAAAPTLAKDAEGGVSAITKTGEAAGGLGERAIQALTLGKAEVGTIANAGVGKAIGNIGGAIDIGEDLANIGKVKNFSDIFNGGNASATAGDKVSNALTVGGTILDVASLALPFLAPVAAAVQVVGAIDGTYNSVKDNEQKAADTKGAYTSSLSQTVVPPSLSGVGFLATTQSDPRKLIGGTGSF